MDTIVSARLEIPGEHKIVEPVIIENISQHGARVVTGRACDVNVRVIVSDLIGSIRVEARVVYCQSLHDGRCAIGLHFNESAGA
ncbi:MAG: PilZ domain-containing protein [Steroidobacterales bacterium]